MLDPVCLDSCELEPIENLGAFLKYLSILSTIKKFKIKISTIKYQTIKKLLLISVCTLYELVLTIKFIK
jgi:hypothetical protein